jgi:type II secretory pathway component PulF
MPTFTYNAIDGNGQASSGTLTADTRTAALDTIAGRGLTPVKIEGGENTPAPDAGSPRKVSWRSQRVTPAQVEAFTRELANLLAAGVPLAKSLSIIRREASNPAAKAQWSAIHDDVVGGKPLAEAMARWSDSFPQVYVAMVRAGEVGGFLEVVLNQIADFRAREGDLVGKVKSALVYPAVLATLAASVLVFLMTYFIPKFSGMFEEFGAALPLLTRCILAASHAVTSYGIFVLIIAIGLYVFGRRVLRSDSGRRFVEAWSLRIPGLGIILARFSLVRFSRMLGTLLGAGVPLVTSLRVAQEAIGNQTLSDAVSQAIEEVKRGTALSRSLATCKELFPTSVVEMIAVAEESGRLDKELLRLAQTYEGELDRRLRMLVALVEPALLFIMAALIGTIVVGMLLPIFTLQDLIK